MNPDSIDTSSEVERLLTDNAAAFHAARRYMQTATPYAPKSKATQLRELLASWGQSDFAAAASSDDGENLLNALVGQLARLEDAEEQIAALSPSPVREEVLEEAAKALHPIWFASDYNFKEAQRSIRALKTRRSDNV